MFGVPELQIVLVLIGIAAVVEWWRLRHAGPNLVVREFRAGTVETTGEFLYILGRRSGLIAWLLVLFGLHAQTSFSVTDREVARETVGPRGFEYVYAPLSEIGVSRCSYHRAILALVSAIAVYLYGLITLATAVLKTNDYVRQAALASASTTLWICLILGTACYLWYSLSKRIVISLISHSEVEIGISFKRSVIENVSVHLAQSIEVVDLINARILAGRSSQ